MGNCQVSEAATVAIQHPGGRFERLYWPTSASEVMKSHPGHHVALVTLYGAPEERRDGGGGAAVAAAAVSFTRVRLLKPSDTLVLGQVYRLVTVQEVMKAIEARKNEKMKRREAALMERQQQQQISGGDDDDGVVHHHHHHHHPHPVEGRRDDDDDSGNTDQGAKQVREQQQKTISSKQWPGRHRHWRPSLKSIEEIAS